MITTPIVFVLGAGASADFEFPIGLSLLRNVVKYRVMHPGSTHMRELGWSEGDLSAFCNALDRSADTSIDAFLEKRPEFMELGKACMAVELIGCERTERLFRDFDQKTNWLKYLFRRMQGPSFEGFAENAVSFVTFNYDRVLEHFLFVALQNSWGKSAEDVADILNQIPIVHLHGQLGFLPWQPNHRGRVRPFEPTIDIQSVHIAAQGIKVVHEGVEDRKEQFDQAKKLIGDATRVYFLGVGTANVNLERIGVADFVPNNAYATEVGLTLTEFNEAQGRYGDKLQFRRSFDCSQMISDFVDWT